MPSLGSFILIFNEAPFIAMHLASWLPHLSEMVFYDGGSTDGTLEIIMEFKKSHPDGRKIKLFKNKNPKNLREDYTRLFDECLHELSTDLAAFIHPDFYLEEPGNLANLDGGLSYTMSLRSFAGNPWGPLFEIIGRGEKWKNIYTLRPNLGLHYMGTYGSAEEDCYYREITGNEYANYGQQFDKYPYEVVDSGAKVWHFSDVRTPSRRLERMRSVLTNQGYDKGSIYELAVNHPRVSLQSGNGFEFVPAEYPIEFLAAREKYAHLMKVKEPACA